MPSEAFAWLASQPGVAPDSLVRRMARAEKRKRELERESEARAAEEALRSEHLASAKRDLPAVRERCKTLAGFIREAWPVLEPMAEYKEGWAIRAMCDHLEAVTRGEILRLLMNVPPGMMKSLLTGVFWPAWEWGPMHLPSMRYLGTSYSETYAVRDVGKMRELIESDWYQALWGAQGDGTVLKGRKWGEKTFQNSALGWRAGTPFTRLTGGRGDRLIIDDPLSADQADSDAERGRAERRFRETVPSRINDPQKSAIVVIMQRLHERDTSGLIQLLDLPYEKLILPMEFEPARRCRTSIGFVDPRQKEGELLFPERFDAASLADQKQAMTEYAISGQLQQRPTPREGAMFKTGWFEVVDVVPAGGMEARCWDLAATQKGQSGGDPDWTVGLKGKKVGDTFYVTDMVRIRETSGIVTRTIHTTATQDGRACHIRLPQDPGQAGKSQAAFFVTLLAGWPLTIQPVTGDKETRARPAAAQAEWGKVKLVRAPWNRAFLDEVTVFPAGSHDDIVDALSDLVDVLSSVSNYDLMTAI